MKHYRAKPSTQLSKHLQDDIKHAVMKLELDTPQECSLHAIAQCARNLPARQSRARARADITSIHDLKLEAS